MAITKTWWRIFSDEMGKHGYVRERGSWVDVGAIREALDDTDKFDRECNHCDYYASRLTPDNIEDFHKAHVEAGRAASALVSHDFLFINSNQWQIEFQRVYANEMAKRGFPLDANGNPIKEDLDDTDTFSPACDVCSQNEEDSGVPNPPDFHIAHIQAEDAASRAMAYMFDWTAGPEAVSRMQTAEHVVMRKYGYTKKHNYWIKAYTVKEDLDDKDEFISGLVCEWPGCDDLNSAEFHEAHGEAWYRATANIAALETTAGGTTSTWINTFKKSMIDQGWTPVPTGNDKDDIYHWEKGPVKEDLDDKDTFGDLNVNHRQAFDSTGEKQHWLITMFNDTFNEYIDGEYYVLAGERPVQTHMYIINISQVDDKTARTMIMNASKQGYNRFHYDWNQALEDARKENATR
jgi:hypothetical protein